jgi:hypothetical protein
MDGVNAAGNWHRLHDRWGLTASRVKPGALRETVTCLRGARPLSRNRAGAASWPFEGQQWCQRAESM